MIENKIVKSEKHIRVLRFLEQNDGVLRVDLEAFCDVSKAILNTLEKNGYIEIVEKHVERNPFLHKVIKQDNNLVLTKEQQNAYEKIVDVIDKKEFKEFLIYGVTGSRKNRNIFTTYRKGNKTRKICYYASTRNFINTTAY